MRRQAAWIALGMSVLACAPAGAAEEHASLAIPVVAVSMIDAYLAADEGLWKDEGLAVTIQEIQGIGATNAVIAGSIDFAMASGLTVTRANAKGQKLVALATAIDQSDEDVTLRTEVARSLHFDRDAPLAVRARILKGLTIASDGVGAIPDVILYAVAKEAGLARTEVTAAPMAAPEMVAAFQRKQVAGMMGFGPAVEMALLDGSGVLLSDTTKGEPVDYSPVSSALLLARADFCPAHFSICTKFVHGIAEASRFVHEHPGETLAVLKRHFGTFSDPVLEASYRALVAIMPVPPVTTPQELENGDRLDIAAGFLEPSDMLSNYAAIIDNRFAK